VLFNVAAVMSQQALQVERGTPEGATQACKIFQVGCWVAGWGGVGGWVCLSLWVGNPARYDPCEQVCQMPRPGRQTVHQLWGDSRLVGMCWVRSWAEPAGVYRLLSVCWCVSP
jgi:hypothetical protein